MESRVNGLELDKYILCRDIRCYSAQKLDPTPKRLSRPRQGVVLTSSSSTVAHPNTQS